MEKLTIDFDPPLSIPPNSTAQIAIEGDLIHVTVCDNETGKTVDDAIFRRDAEDPRFFRKVLSS